MLFAHHNCYTIFTLFLFNKRENVLEHVFFLFCYTKRSDARMFSPFKNRRELEDWFGGELSRSCVIKKDSNSNLFIKGEEP
ncbi:hypothetical protein RIF29_17723 [Crotalaria pallida]|uniref:Uncharacterized protein n=1 Tax=Crotalaria pallida TaxID=3830 RepID=A0AAN9IGP9_CROPI